MPVDARNRLSTAVASSTASASAAGTARPMATWSLADILTVREVADYLRVPEKTVYQLVRSGKLPAFKAGRHWRVTSEAVGTFIASATSMARNGRSPS